METSIEWDDPSKSYFAGGIVTGVLVVSNSLEDLKIMSPASAMTITGEGIVKWTILIQTDDPECPVDYRKLVKRRTFLYRKVHYALSPCDDDGLRECIINPGNNHYPFSFTLPYSLPSSFEGSHGKISYHVEIALHIAGQQEIIRKKDDFLVTAIYNLKNDSAAADIGQCFMQIAGESDGIAGVLVKTPKIGFTPGEIIPIYAKIINKSTYQLQLRFFICQRDTFRIQDQVKCTYKIVGEQDGPHVIAGETKSWRNTSFRLPNVKIIGESCDIIRSTFTLEIETVATGRSPGFFSYRRFIRTGNIPLIVGTIPTTDSLQGSSVAVFEELDTLNEEALFLPSAPPLDIDPNEPPPSYEAAMAATPTRRRSEAHRRRAPRNISLATHYGTL